MQNVIANAGRQTGMYYRDIYWSADSIISIHLILLSDTGMLYVYTVYEYIGFTQKTGLMTHKD